MQLPKRAMAKANCSPHEYRADAHARRVDRSLPPKECARARKRRVPSSNGAMAAAAATRQRGEASAKSQLVGGAASASGCARGPPPPRVTSGTRRTANRVGHSSPPAPLKSKYRSRVVGYNRRVYKSFIWLRLRNRDVIRHDEGEKAVERLFCASSPTCVSVKLNQRTAAVRIRRLSPSPPSPSSPIFVLTRARARHAHS